MTLLITSTVPPGALIHERVWFQVIYYILSIVSLK